MATKIKPSLADYWRLYAHGMTPARWLKLVAIIAAATALMSLYAGGQLFWADKIQCEIADATIIQSQMRPTSSRWARVLRQQIAETSEGDQFLIARPDPDLDVGDAVVLRIWCDSSGERLYRAGFVTG